jgi:hypothetical protein
VTVLNAVPDAVVPAYHAYVIVEAGVVADSDAVNV